MTVVYKYLSPERLDYFDNDLLRFTQPQALNDLFECLPMITVEEVAVVRKEEMELHREAIKADKSVSRNQRRVRLAAWESVRKRQTRSDTLRALDDYWKKFHDFQNREIGIFSVSSRRDSSLMWAHYCRSHEGFCIGFDSRHSFFRGNGRKPFEYVALKPVSYSDHRVKIPTERGRKLQTEHLFVKSQDWKYEEEQRLIYRLRLAEEVKPSKPFPIHLFRVPHEAVSEVVLGARATEEVISKALEFSKQMQIPLLRAGVSNTSFNMVVNPVVARTKR